MKKKKVGEEVETYVCKKIRLYSFLTEKGFVPYKMVRDNKNPMYLIWLYDDSPKLQQAVTEYYNNL